MTVHSAHTKSQRKERRRLSSAAAGIACAFLVLLSGVPAAKAGVLFVGLDEQLETNVRTLMPLASSKCDASRWRIDRLFRDADKTIAEALQALGYYEPVITKSLHWDADCWHARFELQAGPPVLISSVDIAVLGAGADDSNLLPRIQLAAPATGDVLHHGTYENYKSALLRSAINAGYFDADFEQSHVSVDRAARTAAIELQLQSGPKYEFGAVSFTEGIIHDEMLQRYTDIRPGTPYAAKPVNELYDVLNGSGYFASVTMNTEPLDTTQKIVPLNVNLTPAKRHLYSIGGGFTTDTGPHGRMGYTNRRLNDKGHQLDSKLFLSPVKSELNALYRWPQDDPRREWISFVGGAQHENTDTSRNDTFKIGVLWSRALGKNWLETRYIDYEYEDFQVADQQTTSQLIIFGTNWETEKGRSLSRVLNGYRFNQDIRGASDSAGSDTSFLQLRTKAKWIHSFGERTRVLARVTLATTIKDEITELPASVRFFAGGDHSIRGYEFESLGPVNADGEVIGGSNLVEGSIEIDRLFREKWAIAAFVDSGSAFNSTDAEFSTGVGIGIRWYSPVGPIRVDFAHPLDDPDSDFRLHISLGPDL